MKWIKADEQRPKDFENVLIAVDKGEKPIITTSIYQKCDTWTFGGHRVLAWMKLPEYQREETKEETNKIMETKMVKVPFNIELAKQITNGEKEGRIVDNDENHYRIVCFDLADDKGKIIGLRKNNNYTETALTFNDNGCCVQHPSRNLMLEVPEYTTFKDGDILCCVCGPFMYNGNYKVDDRIHYGAHCGINSLGKLNIEGDRYITKGNSSWSSDKVWYATEKERQQLIDALKQSTDPRAKDCLKKLGIEEEKPKCEFKPFDRVLIRYGDDDKWTASIFSHKEEGDYPLYCCVNGRYEQCIPYNEQTAHLLGTTESTE